MPNRRIDLLAVTVHDLHLGVVAGHGKVGEALEVVKPFVYGTAFPIRPGVFATAAHVLREAKADAGPDGVVALFRRGREDIESGPVIRASVHDGIDLALLECPYFGKLPPLPMMVGELDLFTRVSAAGYPLAVDGERLAFVLRGFAGTVVTRRELYHLPSQPPGYELSFPAPRGLSGAPLVRADRDGTWCVGYIVENWKYSSGDFVAGLAVDSEALVRVESPLLGGSLGAALGVALPPPRPPTPVRNPLMVPFEASAEGWPDEDLLNPEEG
jgi:hypothetical protein